MNNFEENDYGHNDFEENKDFHSLNAYETKLVDIRIILTDMDYLEFISKAVSNFDLSNFNVNISSIVPTSNIEIAKNTISGADLVLIAAEDNEKGYRLYQNFKKALKNEFNYIEYLKLPSLDELDDYDYDGYNGDNIFEDEIANSIIRGGLYSISNLSSINHHKRMYMKIKNDFEDESLKYDKIIKENEVLIKESKSFRERNEKLSEEVKVLQRELDKIKSDYSDLKSRFDSIHTKNSLEVYSLNDLWYELFDEHLSQDIYKFILISTDNFRPKNLMIGQGVICAESKDDALDWLKIIKTAFILADTNKQDLDYNNFKSNFKFDDIEEFGVSSSYENSSSLDSSIFNDLDDSFFTNGNSKEKDSFNESDDGFIYNERYEGNSNLEEDSDEFIIRNAFNKGLSQEKEKEKDDINVFNLNSLKLLDDEEEEDSNEMNSYESSEDYDYDEEDMDENDDEEVYSPFSNLWD